MRIADSNPVVISQELIVCSIVLTLNDDITNKNHVSLFKVSYLSKKIITMFLRAFTCFMYSNLK